ncbi:MAG TPA: hypothetical protein VMF66_09550 [Candidatus Acidoferrum sp.]|nr:hypothetical protein [Candidatus Acidoferrum sp.]
MPDLDDPFETYLKKFRPLDPAPFLADVPAKAPEKRRHLGITIWALALAATAILAILLVRIPAHHLTENKGHAPQLRGAKDFQPLTLNRADRALAESASIEAALDSLESKPARISVLKGAGSALAALSEEN